MDDTLRQITQSTGHLCQMAETLNNDNQNNTDILRDMSQSLDQLIQTTRTFKNDIELNNHQQIVAPLTVRQRLFAMFRRH
jgi:hypothetical protein